MQSYRVKIQSSYYFYPCFQNISFNALMEREQALELNKDFYLILRFFFPFQLVTTQIQ